MQGPPSRPSRRHNKRQRGEPEKRALTGGHTPPVRVADRVLEFIQNYLVVKCSYSTFQTWIMEVPADNLMTSDGLSGDVRPTSAFRSLGRSAANHIDARPRPRGTALGPVLTQVGRANNEVQ